MLSPLMRSRTGYCSTHNRRGDQFIGAFLFGSFPGECLSAPGFRLCMRQGYSLVLHRFSFIQVQFQPLASGFACWRGSSKVLDQIQQALPPGQAALLFADPTTPAGLVTALGCKFILFAWKILKQPALIAARKFCAVLCRYSPANPFLARLPTWREHSRRWRPRLSVIRLQFLLAPEISNTVRVLRSGLADYPTRGPTKPATNQGSRPARLELFNLNWGSGFNSERHLRLTMWKFS